MGIGGPGAGRVAPRGAGRRLGAGGHCAAGRGDVSRSGAARRHREGRAAPAEAAQGPDPHRVCRARPGARRRGAGRAGRPLGDPGGRGAQWRDPDPGHGDPARGRASGCRAARRVGRRLQPRGTVDPVGARGGRGGGRSSGPDGLAPRPAGCPRRPLARRRRRGARPQRLRRPGGERARRHRRVARRHGRGHPAQGRDPRCGTRRRGDDRL